MLFAAIIFWNSQKPASRKANNALVENRLVDARFLLRGGRYGQRDVACLARFVPDALRRFRIVRSLRVENVRYESLWVAIVEREQCGLHLHHDAVSGLEGVVHIR